MSCWLVQRECHESFVAKGCRNFDENANANALPKCTVDDATCFASCGNLFLGFSCEYYSALVVNSHYLRACNVEKKFFAATGPIAKHHLKV